MGRPGPGTGGEPGERVPMEVPDVTAVDGLLDAELSKIPTRDELDVDLVGGGGDERCVLLPSRGPVVGDNSGGDGDDGRDTAGCLSAERRAGGGGSCMCVDGSVVMQIGRAHV